MREAAAELEFEEAARLRDEIQRLENQELELPGANGKGRSGGGFADRMRRADAAAKSRKGKGEAEREKVRRSRVVSRLERWCAKIFEVDL